MVTMRRTTREFRRALVIDDEIGLQLLVKAILEQGSYMVDVARDGHEACDRVQDNSYDAIVCDLRMPKMDGTTFFGKLKELNRHLAQKVIFITGVELDTEIKRAVRESGRPLLRKPFGIEELEDAVDAVASGTA